MNVNEHERRDKLIAWAEESTNEIHEDDLVARQTIAEAIEKLKSGIIEPPDFISTTTNIASSAMREKPLDYMFIPAMQIAVYIFGFRSSIPTYLAIIIETLATILFFWFFVQHSLSRSNRKDDIGPSNTVAFVGYLVIGLMVGAVCAYDLIGKIAVALVIVGWSAGCSGAVLASYFFPRFLSPPRREIIDRNPPAVPFVQ